jgi:hypothetical protein
LKKRIHNCVTFKPTKDKSKDSSSTETREKMKFWYFVGLFVILFSLLAEAHDDGDDDEAQTAS